MANLSSSTTLSPLRTFSLHSASPLEKGNGFRQRTNMMGNRSLCTGHRAGSWWPQGGRLGQVWTSQSAAQSPDSPDSLRLQLTFFRYDTVLLLFLHELREDSVLLDQGQVVALSPAGSSGTGRSPRSRASVGNDGNPVPRDVRLIHVVRGEDNGACRHKRTGT